MRANATLVFDRRTGGQGGEGMTAAGQWWVENVMEECDAPEEFYYDAAAQRLYFNFNGSAGAAPPPGQTWEVPQARQLLALTPTLTLTLTLTQNLTLTLTLTLTLARRGSSSRCEAHSTTRCAAWRCGGWS